MESFFSQKHNRVLGTIALATAALAFVSYAVLNFRMTSSTYPMPANISVVGEGEVTAVPNVGQFSFAVTAEGTTAAEVQELSGTKINDILAYLKGQGIEEKDIKTRDYNMYPKYKYEERMCAFGSFCPPGEQVQDGFSVSQTVEVKVRDTAKSGELIAGVGEKGATNISGLNFIVDDAGALKAEARSKAVADAKAKAEKLATDLGVDLVRITSYYENEGYYPEPYYAKMEMSADAGGFAGAEMPVGENTTKVQVNVSYEVR